MTAAEAAARSEAASRTVADPEQLNAVVKLWLATIGVAADRGLRVATEGDVNRAGHAFEDAPPAVRRMALMALVERNFRVNSDADGKAVVSW